MQQPGTNSVKLMTVIVIAMFLLMLSLESLISLETLISLQTLHFMSEMFVLKYFRVIIFLLISTFCAKKFVNFARRNCYIQGKITKYGIKLFLY